MKISDNAVKLAAATLALLTACSCSDISGAQTPAPAKETGKVVIVEPDEAGPGALDYDVIPDDGVTSTAKRKAPEDTEAAETVTSTAVPEITTTTTTPPETTTTTKAPETTTTTAAPETTTTTSFPPPS